MFTHKGKSRTLKHNLGIASLLSFVAGIVNVSGFLSVAKLTTNVTGHFAYIVEEAIKLDFNQSFFYFLYVLFFLLGAFYSNLLIEITHKLADKNKFILPILTEILILTSIGFLNFNYVAENPNLIACSLLFAMGLQNSLVTTISNSVVRTTHLTGLFTDLGIEFSQLFFYKTSEQRKKLIASIKLRLTIISTFFIGGIFAGTFFSAYKMKTLLFASLILLLGIIIDIVTLKIENRKEKIETKKL
jgi:uncharacterized membrane protein YoaK (UPF0700 family)